MKILVAEDQAAPRLLLRRLLERLGHEVVDAPDGLDAWRRAGETWFPVIISDWVMPGLDGLDLCRRVRGQSGRPYSYIILLTSKSRQQDRLEGLGAGADDFLVKPVDADELAVRLEIARRILAMQEELERRNARLVELARSDELTGVGNRRRFREALDDLFGSESGIREGAPAGPLSLVMADVDAFKAFNDRFGHPAGDEVLRAVAATLGDGVRGSDTVARVGGEEFAVLLPGLGADAAIELAGRLRRAVAGSRWPLRAITASFGVATTGAEVASPSVLVDRADRALYAAKRAGRDRVVHARDLAADGDGEPPAAG